MKKIRLIKRTIKFWFQRITRGWSDDECWNLDWEFLKWINSRFKVYKEQASKMVDLTFHKFIYKNKEYTQQELIDKVIKLTDLVIKENYFWDIDHNKEMQENINEVFDIFKLIFWTMWW